jgi:hypothetical protein
LERHHVLDHPTSLYHFRDESANGSPATTLAREVSPEAADRSRALPHNRHETHCALRIAPIGRRDRAAL